MKKSIFCLIMFCTVTTCFSQSIHHRPLTMSQEYLKKSKNLHKAGNTLLITGFAAATVPVMIMIGTSYRGQINASPLLLTTSAVGVAMMAGSIPLFIMSGSNKRKGMKVTLENTKVMHFKNAQLVNKSIPSLAITVSF